MILSMDIITISEKRKEKKMVKYVFGPSNFSEI